MFTLEVRYEEEGSPDDTYVAEVKLHFTNDLISLTFIPVCFHAITDFKWEDGSFDTSTQHFDFGLHWKGDFIEMECGGYGGGKGGNLIVRAKATPELIASLKQAFDQWNALF